MSEETLVVDPVIDPVVNTEPNNIIPETSDPYEQEAREQGWKPKEEYEGEPDKWRPAKEFVERGELFGKIDSMGRELKETRKALKLLQEHHTKVRETEYNNALTELKALQKKHLEEGNSDAYLEASELLTDLKAEQQARKVQSEATQKQPDPRFIAWVNENKWYQSDNEMRQFADSLGSGYAASHPEIDPEDVLKYVTTQVKSAFKDKFVNPNRTKPNSVEGAGSQGTNKSTFELTEDERRVMNNFVRNKIMSKEEYIAEVKKLRGAK